MWDSGNRYIKVNENNKKYFLQKVEDKHADLVLQRKQKDKKRK